MEITGLFPQAVLFDLDGTLADSFEGIARAVNAALREEGLATHPCDWVLTHVGRGTTALLRDAAGGNLAASEQARLERAFDRAYRDVFLAQTPPFPGAAGVLARVGARTDGRVAIVSNKFERYSRAWVNYWGLGNLVTVVVGPDTFGARKPDPAMLRPVLQRFGAAPGDTLLVGDMVVDVAAGRAAGIPVVCVRGAGGVPAELRRAGALAVLADLRDLPGWLAGNGHGWR